MEVFTHVCLSSLKKMSKNFFLDIFCLKKNFLSKKKKKIKPESCFPTKQLLFHCWMKTHSSFLSVEQTVEHFFFCPIHISFFMTPETDCELRTTSLAVQNTHTHAHRHIKKLWFLQAAAYYSRLVPYWYHQEVKF